MEDRTSIWNLRVVLVFLIFSLPVLGQEGNQEPDLLDMDIEALLNVRVTGSHLRHVDASDFGTVTVMNRDAILRSGVISIEALLQRMPVSAGYAGNQFDAYWGGSNGNGSTHVNLRGLGINRTLVLLNGRRLVNGGTGANASVDLNNIPLAIVEKIEIFKGGASAVYGTDAVAGVVNIITRKSVNGSEASLQYGETFKADGNIFVADLVWGSVSERGSLLLGASHSGNSKVNMADRAGCGLGESGGKLICVDSGNTIGGRALLADGRVINFNQDPGGNASSFEPYSSGKHNFNANPYLNAMNPLNRTSASVLGTWKLNSRITAFSELMYTERHSDQTASPGTLGLNRPIPIAADHPTNPTGQSLILQRRRLLEAGTRNIYQDIKSLDAVIGLEGKLAGDWEWSLALDLRRNESHDGIHNIANLDRVDETLNTAVCSNAPGAAIPCANYLGYGNVTSSVLDYIMLNSQNNGGNEQKSFSASMRGQAFELPVGPVNLAVGVEVRKNMGWRNPDPLVESGVANDNRQDSVSGQYMAREAFTEILVPLLSEKDWAKNLDLNSAVRVSDYDLFGQTTNYKIGVNWQLISSLNFHASSSTAFRAPNIPELYAGTLKQNLIAADPCSGWINLPATSVVYQNCQAAQVPQGYQQSTTSILTTLGGNRNLKPEQAKIISFGTVWEPTSSLRLGLDYFDINIESGIGSVDGASKLAACYNTPGLTHPFCSSANFTRDPVSGDIDFLSVQQMNEASERTTSADLAIQYQFALADWNAKANLQVSNLRKYDVVPYLGAAKTQLAGKITSGRGSYAHWRSLGALTLENGPWSGSYSLQYIGEVDHITAAAKSIGSHVPGVTYNNVQLQYALGKSLDLVSGIDNLFNQPPPYVFGWIDVNTDTMTYDVLGRRWYSKIAYRW